MYCVKILYPRGPHSNFNFEHYYNVHSPLGIEMLMKHGGVRPVRVLIDELKTNDSQNNDIGYHCICSVYFKDKAGAEAMMGMFEIDEPRRLLSEDFPNYTETEPQIVVTKVTELDPETGAIVAS